MLSGEKYKRNTLKKSYFRRAKSEALDNIAVEAKREATTLLGAHDTERLRESRIVIKRDAIQAKLQNLVVTKKQTKVK